MPFFRKKPIVVEAMQLQRWNFEAVESFCNGLIRGTKLPVAERVIEINTPEGDMRAQVGDWVIKGVAGEFYPCKPDIFEETYEAAEMDET